MWSDLRLFINLLNFYFIDTINQLEFLLYSFSPHLVVSYFSYSFHLLLFDHVNVHVLILFRVFVLNSFSNDFPTEMLAGVNRTVKVMSHSFLLISLTAIQSFAYSNRILPLHKILRFIHTRWSLLFSMLLLVFATRLVLPLFIFIFWASWIIFFW